MRGARRVRECHSEIFPKLAKGPHKTISCETCHGVSRDHADNPDIKAGIVKDHVTNADLQTRGDRRGGHERGGDRRQIYRRPLHALPRSQSLAARVVQANRHQDALQRQSAPNATCRINPREVP